MYLAEQNNATVSGEYVFIDNDISASTLSKKPRPEWNRPVSLIEAGKVKRVFAYSSSRLTRRPRELEDLIDLYEATGVLFKTAVSGDYDLSTADGRKQARQRAADDAAEAERTSERVTRQKKQRAMQGKPQGGRTLLTATPHDGRLCRTRQRSSRKRSSAEPPESPSTPLRRT